MKLFYYRIDEADGSFDRRFWVEGEDLVRKMYNTGQTHYDYVTVCGLEITSINDNVIFTMMKNEDNTWPKDVTFEEATAPPKFMIRERSILEI